MKCLLRYRWVKLLRSRLPEGKGLLGSWTKLASRAAFREGYASYCGHCNAVSAGSWVGGVVGLKRILGVKSRTQALKTLDTLTAVGLLAYERDSTTKKLTYQIKDWVVQRTEKADLNETVYTTDGYGFLCLPRSIPDRLAERQYIFEEADAWLDLWCHTVFEDPNNAFSFLAPTVQYGRHGAVLTLATLGKRWNWEKTKVFRFFKKHGDVFRLTRLNGSYGCLVFNKRYPTGTVFSIPQQEEITRILRKLQAVSACTPYFGSDHERLNELVARYSRRISAESITDPADEKPKNRVALFVHIYRAYFSLCRNWKECAYDCGKRVPFRVFANHIRGPCGPAEQSKKIRGGRTLCKTKKTNRLMESRRTRFAPIPKRLSTF